MTQQFKEVWCLGWEERDRWSGPSPIGISLHNAKEDVQAFIKEHWSRYPDAVPDTYDRPKGEAFKVQVIENYQIIGFGNRIYNESEAEEVCRSERLIWQFFE